MSDSKECAYCHIPFSNKKKKREFRRRVFDKNTNKILIVCNACGLKHKRLEKIKKPKVDLKIKKNQVKIREPDKDKYIENAKQFAKKLSVMLQDEKAKILYCPGNSRRICGCIQTYLSTIDNLSGNNEISTEKALQLLNLHKTSIELIKCKVQRPINQELTSNEIKGYVNLRTQEYDDFVFKNRERLKTECKLCEHAVQKILSYSFNYLHKQLKTSNRGPRIASRKSSLAERLPEMKQLLEQKCCSKKCTRMVGTHGKLVENWRKRYPLGQQDARVVLNEMLTPAGGAVNCNSFIQMVTGCSLGLLKKVKKEIRLWGGYRYIPEHKLHQYWRQKKLIAPKNTIPEGTLQQMTTTQVSPTIKQGKISEKPPQTVIVTRIERKSNDSSERHQNISLTQETANELRDLSVLNQNEERIYNDIQSVETTVFSTDRIEEPDINNFQVETNFTPLKSMPVQVIHIIKGNDVELNNELDSSQTVESVLILTPNGKLIMPEVIM